MLTAIVTASIRLGDRIPANPPETTTSIALNKRKPLRRPRRASLHFFHTETDPAIVNPSLISRGFHGTLFPGGVDSATRMTRAFWSERHLTHQGSGRPLDNIRACYRAVACPLVQPCVPACTSENRGRFSETGNWERVSASFASKRNFVHLGCDVRPSIYPIEIAFWGPHHAPGSSWLESFNVNGAATNTTRSRAAPPSISSYPPGCT